MRGQQHKRQDRQSDQSELPVDTRRHVRHGDQRHRRREKRHEPVDDDVLERRGIVLNAVKGIGCSLVIVI